MKTLAAGIAAVLLSVGCVPQEAKRQTTRWPQVVVSAPLDFVRDRMVVAVMNGNATLVDSSDNMLKLQLPVEGASGFWLNAGMGCGYCEQPRAIGNVLMAPHPSGTLVSMQFWTEINQANGSWRRLDSTNGRDFNAALGLLERVKGEIEAAYMDF